MAWDDYSFYGPRGSGGDQNYLRQLRDLMMSDALAAGSGARAAAQRSAGDDPSVAATSGMEAMLRGQSRASSAVAQGRLQWMLERQRRLAQMKLLKAQQGNPVMGALGQLGGAALGAGLGPGGFLVGGASPSLSKMLSLYGWKW